MTDAPPAATVMESTPAELYRADRRRAFQATIVALVYWLIFSSFDHLSAKPSSYLLGILGFATVLIANIAALLGAVAAWLLVRTRRTRLREVSSSALLVALLLFVPALFIGACSDMVGGLDLSHYRY